MSSTYRIICLDDDRRVVGETCNDTPPAGFQCVTCGATASEAS